MTRKIYWTCCGRRSNAVRSRGGQRAKLVHSVEDFRIADWTTDLDDDYRCLSGILDRVEGIGPDDDDKLRELKRFLARRGCQGGKGADLLRG